MKKLFQSKEIKDQVQETLQTLNKTFDRINEVEQALTVDQLNAAFQQKYPKQTDLLPHEELINELAELTAIDNHPPKNIVGELAQQYFYDIKDQLAPIDIQKMDEEIKALWEQRKRQKGIDYLANTPIGVLGHLKEGHSIPQALIDAYHVGNIKSLQDLTHFQIEEVVKPLGLTSQEVSDSIKHVSNVLLEDFYPRFDTNKLSKEDLELIDRLHQRQLINPHIERVVTKILDIIKQHDHYLSHYQSLSLDYSNPNVLQEASREYKQYIVLLDTLLTDIRPLVVEATPLMEATSTNFLIDSEEDFKQNSTRYYALLDQIVQQNSQAAVDHVPNKIVRLVKSFDLDLTDLKGRLRPYQDFGVKFSLYFKRTLLGDEMGLGKTIQAIAVAQHLYNQNKKHTLMVGPLSILINWQREVQEWTDIPNYLYRTPRRMANYEQWKEHGGILITNYQQLEMLRQQDLSFLDFVIIDEAHKIKNPATKMSMNSRYMMDLAEYVLLMTGTAIENRVEEMTQLIQYINPDLADQLKGDFTTPTPEEYRTQASLIYLRRRRSDVLRELPEKEHIPLWSSFNPEQQTFYNEAVMAGPSGLQAMRYAAFRGGNKQTIEKMQQIIDICDEAERDGNKVLIFSFFTNYVLAQIERFMGERVVGRIDGSINVAQRQELIDNLSKAAPGSALLCQIDSGGVGLNIQSANIVIICEPQWKPSTENQAISRVFRMGQTKDVLVYHLLTEESIDESIVEVLNYKQALFDQYADESEIAAAYEVNENQAKEKVLQMERDRLKAINQPKDDTHKSATKEVAHQS
ncbi:DEAD/DEAH box helicase [Dolosicoccus paucivorans]